MGNVIFSAVPNVNKIFDQAELGKWYAAVLNFTRKGSTKKVHLHVYVLCQPLLNAIFVH